ncbi:MAG: hypothetical protein AAF657_19720 [Acidobacteriota bacterium]
MFYVHRSIILPTLLTLCLGLILPTSACLALEGRPFACDAAVSVAPLQSVALLPSVEGDLGLDGRDLLRLDVPEPGLLSLALSPTDHSAAPSLVFLGRDCRPTRSNILPGEELGRRHAHQVEAGAYFVALTGTGTYYLQIGFAAHPQSSADGLIELTLTHEVYGPTTDRWSLGGVTQGGTITLDRLHWDRVPADSTGLTKGEPVEDPLDEEDPRKSSVLGTSSLRPQATVVLGIDRPGILAIESSTTVDGRPIEATRTWARVSAGDYALPLPPPEEASQLVFRGRFYPGPRF